MEWLKQPLRSRCGPGLAERQVRVLGGGTGGCATRRTRI
jgi:hypothetical protein